MRRLDFDVEGIVPTCKIPRLIPYYGGKHSIAKKYPAPLYDFIIEPFAGSAGYSSLYSDREILLIDKNPVIIEVWEYLINSSKDDILNLPIPGIDVSVDDLDICKAAKRLMGFWLNAGCVSPKKYASPWAKRSLNPGDDRYLSRAAGFHERTRSCVAGYVGMIRHWYTLVDDYYNYPNQEATWFIDPPYSGPAGRAYIHNNIDYSGLAKWCRSRRGQVIVCENAGADWLPFEPLTSYKGQRHVRQEVIWTNMPNWKEILVNRLVSKAMSSIGRS